MLDGFTVRTLNNQIRENASVLESSTHPSYNCSENCSFVISPSSLVTGQNSFQKFLKFKKAMLLYININTLNFTLKPDDKKKQNQFLEWQWTLTKNFWYLRLPIDLDYTSFHISYVGESRIRLEIETLNSDCCVINKKLIDQIRNRLWSDVLLNKSESLLCNRYFEDQTWKNVFYFLTTVWVGYDLFCKAPDVDNAYSEKTKAYATLLIPIICFCISLYFPLVNKIVESRHIRRHLNHIKRNLSHGMKFNDYLEGDSPFGYRRLVLKLFFLSKLTGSKGISKFLPMSRLNCVYSFLFLIYLLLPMVLEIIYDEEELKDFNTIYKLGLPVFSFTEKEKIDFLKQIAISLALIPCIWFAYFWSYKQMSETSDYLIYFKWTCRCLKTCVNCKTKPCKCTDRSKLCVSCSMTEDVDDVMNNIKRKGIEENSSPSCSENRNRNSKEQRGDQDNEIAKKIIKFIEGFETVNFYSKFIKRFSLLLSTNFWTHIWTQSTDTPNLCCFAVKDVIARFAQMKDTHVIKKDVFTS